VPGSDEVLTLDDLHEAEELALDEVHEQTRRFLGFLLGVGLLGELYLIWSRFWPALEVFDHLEAFGGFSIADVVLAALIIAITLATIRNLPGLLEAIVLRRLDLDAGTRNAMVTLAKYAVFAVGAVVLFRSLGVDCSQFGWIAAALSVGLGFGLQEVVANFVSGIILLFERPIRVGDVVTVDGIDGVVTRIQIRATTITNWDRKEFIVPNKQFVTGALLNWTRGNAINRIVIPVGVAFHEKVCLEENQNFNFGRAGSASKRRELFGGVSREVGGTTESGFHTHSAWGALRWLRCKRDSAFIVVKVSGATVYGTHSKDAAVVSLESRNVVHRKNVRLAGDQAAGLSSSGRAFWNGS